MTLPRDWAALDHSGIEISFLQFLEDLGLVPFPGLFLEKPVLALAILSVFLLIAVTLFLLIYIIFTHIKFGIREKRKNQRFKEWEHRLFPLMEQEISFTEFQKIVTPDDHENFWEFISPYLRDTRGDYFSKFVDVLRKMGMLDRERHLLLHAPQDWRRSIAAHRLGIAKAAEATEDLMEAIQDKNTTVLLNAAAALMRLGNKKILKDVIVFLLKMEALSEELFSEVIVGYGEPINRDTLEELNLLSYPSRARLKIIDFIGYFKIIEGATLLISLLKHSQDKEEKIHIIKALGHLGVEEAIPVLKDNLKDENPIIRAQAVKALGSLKDPNIIKPIASLIEDRDWWCRYYAASSLFEMGEAGRKCLNDLHGKTEDPFAKDIIDQFLSKPA